MIKPFLKQKFSALKEEYGEQLRIFRVQKATYSIGFCEGILYALNELEKGAR